MPAHSGKQYRLMQAVVRGKKKKGKGVGPSPEVAKEIIAKTNKFKSISPEEAELHMEAREKGRKRVFHEPDIRQKGYIRHPRQPKKRISLSFRVKRPSMTGERSSHNPGY